jgi:DNA-binding transcriptional ArsR family regulator
VFELQMAPDDFTRIQFGYSPLAEAIGSLHMLHSGHAYPVHHRWADDARHRLRQLDTELLWAIAPPSNAVITPPLDLNAAASVEHQLQLVAQWPPDQLRAELEIVWSGRPMASAARKVIADGPVGAGRVAAALAAYWDTVIAPRWNHIRAVLEGDIAHRARYAALGGLSTMLNGLHPQLRLDQSTIRLAKTFCPANQTLAVNGKGVLLMPSIFRGPDICFDPATLRMPAITYSPRGLGAIWDKASGATGRDPVSALIGQSRAAILRSTGLPKTTTDLAHELHVSGATVSVHLATLKSCGMVTSWRSGQRVFYQRTPLAASILVAVSNPHAAH